MFKKCALVIVGLEWSRVSFLVIVCGLLFPVCIGCVLDFQLIREIKLVELRQCLSECLIICPCFPVFVYLSYSGASYLDFLLTAESVGATHSR